MLGINPVAIPLSFENTKYPTIEDKMKKLLQEREEALAAHELARSRMAGRRHDTFKPFEKGQKVWLDSRNLKTQYNKKIGPKREGPFEIDEVLGPLTYRLKLPNSWKIHNVFHAILLRPYMETEDQYYVQWEGYPITEASWELESAFSTDGDTLANYKE